MLAADAKDRGELVAAPEKIKRMTPPLESPLLPVRIQRCRRSDGLWGPWHCHRPIEILYIESGEMEVCVEQQLYRLCQGDVVIIGSDLPHREQSLDTSFIHFQFDGNAFVDPGAWIRRAWSADARSNPFHGGCTFADNLRAKRMMARFIRQIDREMTGKSVGYEMAVDILIRRLLLALLRESRLSVLPAAEHVGMERLRPALDYIDRHLTGKIRVEELRRLTHCSYAHFVKYFKEVMGLPLVEYINGLRIRKAERLLLTEDMSVDQVAEEVGIPNIGHFYKLFRKMNGCTPGDFRNQ